MKRAAWVLLIVVVLCGGATFLLFSLPSVPRHGSAAADGDLDLAFRPHPGARLPLATTFADEHGRRVALSSFFAKTPVIVLLEYLRCTSLCGVTLRRVSDTLSQLPLQPGRDYQLLAISIDPRDKPADAANAKAKYAALLGHAGASTGLHFLTGSSDAARKIANTIGFPFRYDGLLDAYIHPAGFVIASPNGTISRYVEGISISNEQLIAALGAAEDNSSQGPFARLVLFCHIQGAPLGRYTVPVLGALMSANLAAGFALIALFALILRRRSG